MQDTDSRVRFYALETLYNVVKAARQSIVPIFSDVYLALGGLVTDLDHTTRIGIENLTRLLKVGIFDSFTQILVAHHILSYQDIALESESLDIPQLIQAVVKRLHTNDPFSRY